MISHIPLILSGLGVALAIAAVLSKKFDDRFGASRDIARRLKAPIRGNALVNWRRR